MHLFGLTTEKTPNPPEREDWEQQFSMQIALHNRRIFLALAIFALIAEGFNMINVLFLTKRGLSTLNNRIYFSLYVALFVVSLAAFLFVWKEERWRDKGWSHKLSFVFCLLFCLWSTCITVMDLQRNTNITIFSLGVISVSVLFYLKPWQSCVAILGSQCLLYFLTPLLQLEVNGKGVLIDTTIVSCMAVFMAVTRYQSQFANCKNAQIIVQQNKKIHEINGELSRLVITDPLTGLYNRRFLEENIGKHWDNYVKKEQSVAVMMADIDNFKQYNDELGHLVGDQCMIELAKVLKDKTAGKDCYVIRYGGEEFLLIFFGIESEAACQTAEMLRQAVEEMPLPRPITLSIGICSAESNGPSQLNQYIKKADDALYQAKARGKNQICMED